MDVFGSFASWWNTGGSILKGARYHLAVKAFGAGWKARAEQQRAIIERFRELRLAWFNAHLKDYAHERDSSWEDDAAEERRAKQNEEMKKKYDADTEAIIRGEKKCIAPRCANDLY